MPPERMPPQQMPPERMPPQQMPPERMPPQPSWDSRGWVPLGERTVNGRVDHDRIEVGRYEGKFAKLTMVVENSDLELIDFKIVFGDRTEYHPVLKQVFRDGQRTRALDLPPSEAVIRYIDFKYRNLPGSGEARIQVWGWRTGAAVPPPPAPAPAPAPVVRHSWDTRGWALLGSRQVNGRADRDRIEVGKYEGKFRKLTMAVEDSDLDLVDFRIEFEDRTEYHPKLSYFFKEGQRTRVIDLPPSEHAIRFIDITYKNTRGGGPASVEVWGLRTGGPAPAPAAWDPKGWTLLGQQQVKGRREHADKIKVSRYEPKFRTLTVVVLDSDLELIDLSIKFARGEPFHPEVKTMFREGTRTRAIDLPGDERVIRWIEFKYRNLAGGGRARVQVWAK
jgi:ribosomal protein L33